MTFTTLIGPGALRGILPGTVVCDCTFDLAYPRAGRAAYGSGHIPGATHLGLDTVLSGAKTGTNGRHPLPDRDVFAAHMAGLGVGPDTQVVAYDAGNGMFAARLWFLLRWIGHAPVAVLDGGLAGWVAAGGALEAAEPAPRAATILPVRAPLSGTVDFGEVRRASAEGGRTIVDARAADRFRGENETMDPVAGHIPGARNRPFTANLAAGRFKDPAALRTEFDALLDGRPAAEAVMQCGSGVTACHNLLALEVAGLPGAALYPGSWSEWSAQPGAPVATGD